MKQILCGLAGVAVVLFAVWFGAALKSDKPAPAQKCGCENCKCCRACVPSEN